MSEKALRNIFIFGTFFFLVILGGMTVDSLSQVTSTRTPELTDQVVEGKKTWQKKNCNDCHTILGIGGYYAPEMTKVAERVDGDYLRRFLRNPQSAKPGTSMPNQDLSDTDVNNLVAFLDWVSKIDTNDWPPKPMAGETAATGFTGAQVFQQKGCASCHKINGQGGSAGPGLDQVGREYAGPDGLEMVEEFLENPQAVKPGTTMPRVPLSETERDALAQYLLSLK